MDETTCDECGLTFLYNPKYHECETEESKALRADLLAGRGESWADECVRKVMS
jgi:hypothetical protein